MTQPDGAWIFLSHSTKDWGEIRRIRNYLEERGHRPLVFFLKCLHDHSEIDELIKREIEARTWFLLCDSENARNSKWVQAEVSYIKQLIGKSYEEIDLQSSLDQQLDRVDRLCRRATVFLSYSQRDSDIGEKVRESLVLEDFSVWSWENVRPGRAIGEQIREGIDSAIDRGILLVLLTARSVKSPFVENEVSYAYKKASELGKRAVIVPVFLENRQELLDSASPELRKSLNDVLGFDLRRQHFEKDIQELINGLQHRDW